MNNLLTPPMPHQGRSRRWIRQVWDRLGNPNIYLEPCGGSLAVLLGRPHQPGLEVVCDTSGLVANFWRAMRNDHMALARESDYPTIHLDLTARRRWLAEWSRENREKLTEDPDHYDVRAAGWWAWAASSSLGPGWGSTDGDKSSKTLDGEGQGIQAQRAELVGEVGTGERLIPWFRALAGRLSRVIILNQDWKAAVTAPALREHRKQNLVVGMFLDPPPRTEDRKQTLNGTDLEGGSDETAEETWEWARFTGERYRIAYACREGEMEPPRGWETMTMEFGEAKRLEPRESREMALFSPACIVPQPSLFGPDF